MKKLIAMILTAVMCLSLAACGGGGGNQIPTVQEPPAVEEPEKEPDVVPEEEPDVVPEEEPDVVPEEEPEEVPEEEPEEVTEKVPEEEPAPEAAFDTSWAGAEYEMPIPEPPFANEVEARSNGVKITSVNGGEGGDVTHSNILDYCNTLKEVGFNLDVSENVIGERYGRTCYEFSAKNAVGNSVELLDDGGGVMIFVYF